MCSLACPGDQDRCLLCEKTDKQIKPNKNVTGVCAVLARKQLETCVRCCWVLDLDVWWCVHVDRGELALCRSTMTCIGLLRMGTSV